METGLTPTHIPTRENNFSQKSDYEVTTDYLNDPSSQKLASLQNRNAGAESTAKVSSILAEEVRIYSWTK